MALEGNREGAQLLTVLIMVWLSFGLAFGFGLESIWILICQFGFSPHSLFRLSDEYLVWRAFGLVLESDLVLAPIWILCHVFVHIVSLYAQVVLPDLVVVAVVCLCLVIT